MQKFNEKVELSVNGFKPAFSNYTKCMNITKYRDFQYRLLVNAIHANDRLYYWKKVTSKLCEFCEKGKQTIMHLMSECNQIKQVWNEFKQFINQHVCYKGSITLTTKTIILNSVHPDPKNVINFLVLVTKQYIYAQKCLGQKIMFKQLVENFTKLKELELYNARKDFKEFKHDRKWKIFKYSPWSQERIIILKWYVQYHSFQNLFTCHVTKKRINMLC